MITGLSFYPIPFANTALGFRVDNKKRVFRDSYTHNWILYRKTKQNHSGELSFFDEIYGMKTISRKYQAEPVLVKASGLMSRMYIGAKATISMEVSGDEIVFQELTGDIIASAKIEKITDKKGKPISIDSFDTGFENETIHIENRIVEYKSENKKSKTTSKILFSRDGKVMEEFSMAIKIKGASSLAINNIVFNGTGSQIGEDKITETDESVQSRQE